MDALISHSILAQRCALIYDNRRSDWDHYATAGAVVVGVKTIGAAADAVTVVVFRGSQSGQDWLRDFDARPYEHPRLGTVHAGFAQNMDDVLLDLLPRLMGRQVAITGHSLGAARAWILAGLLVSYRHPPQQVTVFGSPRPGYTPLRDLIRAGVPQLTAYRNRADPVTELPPLLPLPFCHVVAPQPLDAAPTVGPAPIADHYIDCYVRGLAPPAT